MLGRVGMLMASVGLVTQPLVAQQGGDVAPAQAATAARGQMPALTPTEFKTADELLEALESADRDLVSLVADVKYDRSQEVQGDRQVRMGKLFFVVDPPAPGDATKTPQRRFAIKFNRIYIGEVVRDEDKTYIFDGQWLMEKDGVDRHFIKRQVVAPGERFDPLRIGEGPFVLPVGQRKTDIDRRYTAELLPPEAGLEAGPNADAAEQRDAEQLKGAAAGGWQLKLTARPEFAEQEEFSEIRLWYKRGASGDLLPRMAKTVHKNGDISIVLLTDVQLQLAGKPENKAAAVPAGVIDTKAPEGWDGKVEPFRKPVAGEDANGRREGPDVGDK